jgi:hypothetical protein
MQYDRVIYLLDDTPLNRGLIHHYLDVYEYPDGRTEIRANGAALTYRQHDRLSDVDQGAETDNKRLGHVLALSRQVQLERDNRRASDSQSRTNQGEPVKPKMRADNTPRQRELRQIDLNAMILRTSETQAAGARMLNVDTGEVRPLTRLSSQVARPPECSRDSSASHSDRSPHISAQPIPRALAPWKRERAPLAAQTRRWSRPVAQPL